MKRHRRTRLNPILAGLLTGFLFLTLALSLDTWALSFSSIGPGVGAPYDLAHEVTVIGDAQEVVTEQVVGRLHEEHVLVAVAQSIVGAHLGPYLGKDVQQALQAGTRLQIVGAMETLHGEQVPLAGQLIFGGRMITIRSPHGFLVQAHLDRLSVATSRRSRETGSYGGSR